MDDTDDTESELKQRDYDAWLGTAFPSVPERQLNHAIYAAEEWAILGFVGETAEERAITCWRIVERLRKTRRFPEKLRP